MPRIYKYQLRPWFSMSEKSKKQAILSNCMKPLNCIKARSRSVKNSAVSTFTVVSFSLFGQFCHKYILVFVRHRNVSGWNGLKMAKTNRQNIIFQRRLAYKARQLLGRNYVTWQEDASKEGNDRISRVIWGELSHVARWNFWYCQLLEIFCSRFGRQSVFFCERKIFKMELYTYDKFLT